MNWGKSIIVAFIAFAIFIGVLVIICVRQDVNLVSKNYYQEELAYQVRIESMNNYNKLDSKPEVILNDDILQLQLNQPTPIEKGTLVMFRPSDGKFDRRFVVENTTALQQFDLRGLPKGLYRIKLQWSVQSKDYFTEKIITL